MVNERSANRRQCKVHLFCAARAVPPCGVMPSDQSVMIPCSSMSHVQMDLLNSQIPKGGSPQNLGFQSSNTLDPNATLGPLALDSRVWARALGDTKISKWQPEKCVPLSHSPHFGGLIYLRTSDLKIQVAGANSVTPSGWQQDRVA